MSVAVQPVTENIAHSASAGADLIAEQIALLSSGLVFCAKRVAGDDVFRSRLARLQEEAAALAQDFERYTFNDNEDYENLCSLADEKDAHISRLLLELSVLRGRMDKVLAESDSYMSQIRENEAVATDLRADIGRLKTSYQNEREQSKRKNDRLAKEEKAARALNAELTRKLHGEIKAHLGTKASLDTCMSHNGVLAREIRKTIEEKSFVDGETDIRYFYGLKDPKLKFYLHTFQYTLKHGNDELDVDTPRMVNNLNYHINIRTTYSVDLVTSLDEWGRVQYPILELFRGQIPEELNLHLTQLHHNLVAVRNPHLRAFFDWCNGIALEDVDELSQAHRELLKSELGVTTLAQLGSCFTTDLTRLKGVGEVTARKLRQIAYARAADWTKANGQVELEKSMLVVPEFKAPTPRPTIPGAAFKSARSKKRRR